MKQIGVRDLRQNASSWLRRVAAGETFEITDRGTPIALLVPVTEASTRERLIALGELTPAERDFRDLPPPLKLQPGQPPPSEILAEMRADER